MPYNDMAPNLYAKVQQKPFEMPGFRAAKAAALPPSPLLENPPPVSQHPYADQQASQPFLNTIMGGIGDYFSSSPKQQMDDAWKAAGVQEVPDPQNPFGPQDYNDAGWGKPHGRLVSPEQMQFSEADLQAQRNRTPGPMTVPESTGIPATDGGMSGGNIAMQALINAITGDLEKLRAGDPAMKARAQLPSASEAGTNDPVVGGILQRRQLEADLMGMKHQAGMEIAGMGLPAPGGERGVDVGSLARRPNISTGAITSGESFMKQMMDAEHKKTIDAGQALSDQRGAEWLAAVPNAGSESAAWKSLRADAGTGASRPMGARAGKMDAFNQAGLQNRTANRQLGEASANAQIHDNAARQKMERQGRMAGLGSQNAFLNAQQQALINGVMGDGGDMGNLLALNGDPSVLVQRERVKAEQAGRQGDLAMEQRRMQQENRGKTVSDVTTQHPDWSPEQVNNEVARRMNVIEGGALPQAPIGVTALKPEVQSRIDDAWNAHDPWGREDSITRWWMGPGNEKMHEDNFISSLSDVLAADPSISEDFLRREWKRRAKNKSGYGFMD